VSEDPFGRSSKTQDQTLAQMQRILTLSAKQSLVLGLKMSATAVGGAKQNPLPMNPPPQLLSPSAWTVPRLEGGDGLFAVVLGTWGLGAVTPQS
jgi:hypothetical protein